MTTELNRYYRQARERGMRAHHAIDAARRHLVTLADYQTKLDAWNAAPDKRRYADGGIANRPKFPTMYRAPDAESHLPDGFRLFGFLRDESPSDGLVHEPDCGYYTDEYCDGTYSPAVLIHRTDAPHTWACVPAYYDATGCYWCIDTGKRRHFAESSELFDQSSYGSGSPQINRYELCSDARDAARDALRMAERDAEESRQYSERWHEASRHDNEREDARQELKDARSAAQVNIARIRELLAAGVDSNAIGQTRAMLESYIAKNRTNMRRAIATIERETAAIAELDMQGEF